MTRRATAVLGYSTAALLLLVPLGDTLLAVLPASPGEVGWRFGAFGIVGRGLVSPFLALLLTLGVATYLGHRAVQRLVGALAGMAAVALAAGVALFLLDAVQTRTGVVPEMRAAYDLTVGITVARFLIAATLALLFAVYSFRLARGAPARAPATAPAAAPDAHTILIERGPTTRASARVP